MSRDVDILGQLASLGVEKSIVETMWANFTLTPFATAFSKGYGEESANLGYVRGKSKFQIF